MQQNTKSENQGEEKLVEYMPRIADIPIHRPQYHSTPSLAKARSASSSHSLDDLIYIHVHCLLDHSTICNSKKRKKYTLQHCTVVYDKCSTDKKLNSNNSTIARILPHFIICNKIALNTIQVEVSYIPGRSCRVSAQTLH